MVPWGRCYTGALWASLAANCNKPGHHRVAMHSEVRSALAWWRAVLADERLVVGKMDVGVGLDRPLHVIVGVRTDASQFGFGGVDLLHRLYVRGTWDETERRGWSINPRECIVPLFLLSALAQRGVLSGCVVIVQLDNLCSVCAISKQYSRLAALRLIVRTLALLQERYRFFAVPRHLAGTLNSESDGLSRGTTPCECLPNRGAGWTELPIPSSVRRLGTLAQSPSRWQRSLEARECSPGSTIFFDSVLHDVAVPSPETSWIPIPWVPFMCQFLVRAVSRQ